jgi:cytochrome P450
MTTATSDVYYDPYDFEIDADPYPIWHRLREEQPLYYNEKYDFYALSRFEDVEKAAVDWRTYSSAKGTLLELIRADIQLPPGTFIFEDPPDHTRHRGLMSRVFTPRRMNAIEDQVRAFCARTLDPLVEAGGFDFIADLGAEMPMRVIGMLMGVPEEDQKAIKDRIDAGLRLEDGSAMPEVTIDAHLATVDGDFGAYLDWRVDNPSDDLMTQLLQATYEDEDGNEARLTRQEILAYIGLIAGAGNETTTRLIGWTGKVLAEHPEQRAELAANPELIPNAIEELLRFEPPSPVQARLVMEDVELHGQVVPKDSIMLLLNASANRDERKFENGETFDIHRKIDHHLTFGYGIHFCLGAALARLEGRVALEEVLKRFPTWEVDWDNAVQARTSTVRGWEKLPVLVR